MSNNFYRDGLASIQSNITISGAMLSPQFSWIYAILALLISNMQVRSDQLRKEISTVFQSIDIKVTLNVSVEIEEGAPLRE
jgi:hypothetical protein